VSTADPRVLAADAPVATTVAAARPGALPSWRTLLHRPSFVVGGIICLFWVLDAIFWPLIVPYSPDNVVPAVAHLAPSANHWFGTDQLGRDVLSRVLAGASSVLTVAPAATAIGLVLGTAIGLITGYLRGWTDEIGMRVVDAMLTLPTIIIAVVAVGLLGRSELVVTLVIAVTFVPLISRVVRSSVLSERERQYVEAAKIRGEGMLWVLGREILPNVTGPIVVEGTVRIGYAIFNASALAFLNLGPQDPSPDWGLTISENRVYIATQWWTVLFPALAIASLIIGINLLATGMRQEEGR
jgi:peptide/nickel transport system permease protein